VENHFTPHTTTPNPVLKDYGGRALPPLLGYVATELKPRASLDAYVERQGRRDPLIASWKYDAGKTLAVTTDASGRWSGPWIAHNSFAPVWDRILAWMTPESAAEQKTDVALGYQAGRIQVKLTDYSDQPGFESHLVTATVTRPDGTRAMTALGEEAPGELAGSIDAPEPGTYYIEMKSADSKARPLPPLAYTVSPAVTAELPRTEPNYALLEQLAAATGGRLNPSTSDLEITRPSIARHESLDAYLVVTAMLLLIGEALMRRLTA
jgi:Ca-activated chloride channel homolog